MTFFYYEINTRRFIQSTNIRALEEFSGISYHKIWNWFTDGDNLHVDDSVICGCSDLVRGKQRLQNSISIEKGVTVRKVKVGPSGNIGISGCPSGEPGIEGPSGPFISGETGPQGDKLDLHKRTTIQPDNRDMKQYDDFFKEVE